jgi:hypothetical protein
MQRPNVASAARALASVSLVLLTACGGEETEASNAAPSMETAFIAEPVALTERDVERFIAVMKEFRRLGVEYDGKVDTDAGASIRNATTAWSANREAMDILRRNDFDVGRFQRVTHSIMMAAAASEMKGNESNMNAATAQLEAMKGKVAPEMYEQMKKAQEQGMQMRQSAMNQPEGNVELVRRYRDELEALARSK